MKLTFAIALMLLACHHASAQQTPTPEKGKAAAPAAPHKDFSKRPPAQPITAPWTSPQLKLAHTLDLTSNKAGNAEAKRTVKGGEFIAGGWKVTDKLDMLVIELKEGFAAGESGALELDMTNLDFATQADGRKHHFLSLYADPGGRQLEQGVRESDAFFTLRGGKYKDKQTGLSGIKVLWRGGGERGELATFGARQWDTKATYTWRAEWNKDELAILLNGERVFGPAEFKDRDPKMPLKYIYLSKDGQKNEGVWFGFAGPVYKTLRVYREDGVLKAAK